MIFLICGSLITFYAVFTVVYAINSTAVILLLHMLLIHL